ncbi:MAG: hypothetical protein DMF56_00405 [Acidobacteria bacterium]|nr:MAG: hypothetical protein DMF56_00405 [Acidobacteriota bacterium]
MSKVRIAAVVVSLFAAAQLASGAQCVNKFVTTRQGVRQVVTLLTGKLTFQEAQDLAKAISNKQSPPLEWVDDGGKSIARQTGPLQVIRPMPVGCDGKTSGVVMIVTFGAAISPAKKMNVKFDAKTTVAFEQQ